MDQNKKDDMTREIVLTLVTTAIFLAMYWLQEMPEWKREALIQNLKTQFQRVRVAGVSPRIQIEVEKFRAEISAYEHEMRRRNASS